MEHGHLSKYYAKEKSDSSDKVKKRAWIRFLVAIPFSIPPLLSLLILLFSFVFVPGTNNEGQVDAYRATLVILASYPFFWAVCLFLEIMVFERLENSRLAEICVLLLYVFGSLFFFDQYTSI